MSDARHADVRRLLAGALEIPPEERAAFVAAASHGDEAVAREVASLLAADPTALPVLDAPPWRMLELESPPPERLGAYRLLHELGRGATSVVYLAERCDGAFRHRVAIKLLRRGRADPSFGRRFVAERQILAELQHPNIARLYDGGTTPDGRPYFVLEAVDGEPIDRWCDARRATLAERLRRFLSVTAAVQFAHQNLVIHRDLKPGNILVTEAGEPKLLDFGIAKLVAPSEATETHETWPGTGPMTPAYASPEQVRGRPLTTASDVYALGLILHELLTGRRPFGDADSEADRLHSVCHDDPPRPSRAFDTGAIEAIAAARETTPRRLERALRGDLDRIVLKALARDPQRRYATVAELAADLERYLAGRPVLARAGTIRYRAGKFLSRHWREAVAAAALLATLATLTHGRWQRVQRALKERDQAGRVAEFMGNLFELRQQAGDDGDRILARDLLDRGAARIGTELAGQEALQSELYLSLGKAYGRLGLADKAKPLVERSLELRRRRKPADPPAVADALRELATLEASRGRFERAEELAREELELRRRAFGSDHTETIDSMAFLGGTLFDLGHHDEAQRLCHEVLAYSAKDPTHRPERAIAARDLLALVHYHRAEYAEAEALLRETLAELVALRGPAEAQTRATRSNLAAVLVGRGALEEAEALYLEVLALELAASGEHLPAVARVRHNLAGVLIDLERPAEALALLDLAFEARRRSTADDPVIFASLHLRRAQAQAELGALDGAIAEARVALAQREASNGPAHPDTAQAWLVLADLLLEAGQFDEAERRVREALGFFSDRDRPNPVLIAQAESALGGVLLARDRPAEAEPLLRRSVERLTTLRGPRARLTRVARARLEELERRPLAPAGTSPAAAQGNPRFLGRPGRAGRSPSNP